MTVNETFQCSYDIKLSVNNSVNKLNIEIVQLSSVRLFMGQK